MPIRPISPRAAVAAAFCLAALHAGAATITVTSSADNTTADGFCTLREAIVAVNASAASADCPATGSGWGTNDTIAFSILGIPAGGVKTIQPTTGYPALVRRVIVDGTTQPGASSNTIAGGNYPNAAPLNTQVRIEIDGSALASPANGLSFGAQGGNNANGSVVRGLSIVNFANRAGIRIDANAVQVGGNFIGWHADGTTRGTVANFTGVEVMSANNVSIGSAAAADRNLIAGSWAGVQAYYANGVVVEGNLIGVTRNGAQGGAKTVGRGIYLQELTIASIAQNVVANHEGDGIQLFGVQSAVIGGNTVGEGVGGAALGNFRGIFFTNSNGYVSSGNVVYANGIANSQYEGIALWSSAASGDPLGNRLDDNAIYANGWLGINFKPTSEPNDTVTPNDMPDADGWQNFPAITSAQANANGSITIAFTLDSAPGSQFYVSAYANPACHPSGHGEGRYRTGGMSTTVNTDAGGHASGTLTVPAPLPPGWGAGAFVALLAHQGGGGTSEFSACAQVTAAPGGGTPPAMGDVPDQAGTVGTAFSLALAPYVTPTDGDAVTDYAYTGMLPPGLQLSGGTITGTPTQAGTFTVQVRAGDKDGWSGVDGIQFTIAGAGGNPGGGIAAVPTLSGWGRLLAALLLGVAGLTALRRRQG